MTKKYISLIVVFIICGFSYTAHRAAYKLTDEGSVYDDSVEGRLIWNRKAGNSTESTIEHIMRGYQYHERGVRPMAPDSGEAPDNAIWHLGPNLTITVYHVDECGGFSSSRRTIVVQRPGPAVTRFTLRAGEECGSAAMIILDGRQYSILKKKLFI